MNVAGRKDACVRHMCRVEYRTIRRPSLDVRRISRAVIRRTCFSRRHMFAGAENLAISHYIRRCVKFQAIHFIASRGNLLPLFGRHVGKSYVE